jgi:hypothetical protein
MTEGEVRLTWHEGPDLAKVSARQVHCVGHNMTEGEVRLMQREGPRFGLSKRTTGALRRFRHNRSL